MGSSPFTSGITAPDSTLHMPISFSGPFSVSTTRTTSPEPAWGWRQSKELFTGRAAAFGQRVQWTKGQRFTLRCRRLRMEVQMMPDKIILLVEDNADDEK